MVEEEEDVVEVVSNNRRNRRIIMNYWACQGMPMNSRLRRSSKKWQLSTIPIKIKTIPKLLKSSSRRLQLLTRPLWMRIKGELMIWVERMQFVMKNNDKEVVEVQVCT